MTRVWLCWPPQGGAVSSRSGALQHCLPVGDCREVVIAGNAFKGRLRRALEVVVLLELPEMSCLFEKINQLVLASSLKQQLSSM